MASEARPYRGRLQRPCDACRRRKICCIRDSVHDPCSLCKTRGEDCTYLRPPNVRRRTSDVPPRASRGPLSSLNNSTSSPRRRIRYPPGTISDHVNGDHKYSGAWISEFVGLSGDHDRFILKDCLARNLYEQSQYALLRVGGNDETDEHTHFTIIPDALLDPRPDWYPEVPSVDGTSHAHRALMRAYIDHIHPSYPLLNIDMLEQESVSLDPPLLGAIYTLARPFVNADTVSDDFMDTWQAFVFQTLPTERRYPRLATIEAICLWLQRGPKITRSPCMPGLWSEVGSLVGTAQCLGLNVDPSAWDISSAQKQRRIRLANAVFILDKWCSLGLGRPSFINNDDWTVPLPATDLSKASSPNGSEDEIGHSLFYAMSALSVLLGDLLRTFYTLKAAEQLKLASFDDLLDLLKSFEEKIAIFRDNILVPLQAAAAAINGLDPTGTLILAYWTLVISLYKAVLRYLPCAASTLSKEARIMNVRDSARDALMAATDFLANLTVSQTRAFWWSPISRINFAIIGSFMFSMLSYAKHDHEVDFWVNQIDRYRRLLERHSVSFDTTKLAVKRLEVLACVATGLGDQSYLATDRLWNLDI